jgi:hypothetical protein
MTIKILNASFVYYILITPRNGIIPFKLMMCSTNFNKWISFILVKKQTNVGENKSNKMLMTINCVLVAFNLN